MDDSYDFDEEFDVYEEAEPTLAQLQREPARTPATPSELQRRTPAAIVEGETPPGTTTDFIQLGPPTTTDIGYTPAYLKTQIGKRVIVEFLIGTNTFVDRTGELLDVGISYIILRDALSGHRVLADIYSIKFVEFVE